MKPVRIQLKRVLGFRLQAESLRINGLPAVVVSRPSKFGNPYEAWHGFTPEQATDAFRAHFLNDALLLAMARRELRGKNLACGCTAPRCSATVLLEAVNL